MHIPDIVIKSDRLTLKNLHQSNSKELQRILDDKEVCEPAGIGLKEIEDDFDRFFSQLTFYNTALGIYLEDNTLIGYISFFPYSENAEIIKDKFACMISFILGKDYWGKGYASEAVNAMTKYLLQVCDCLVCGHFEDNLKSKRVIEKCGYKYLVTYDRYFSGLNKTRKVIDYIYE